MTKSPPLDRGSLHFSALAPRRRAAKAPLAIYATVSVRQPFQRIERPGEPNAPVVKELMPVVIVPIQGWNGQSNDVIWPMHESVMGYSLREMSRR